MPLSIAWLKTQVCASNLKYCILVTRKLQFLYCWTAVRHFYLLWKTWRKCGKMYRENFICFTVNFDICLLNYILIAASKEKSSLYFILFLNGVFLLMDTCMWRPSFFMSHKLVTIFFSISRHKINNLTGLFRENVNLSRLDLFICVAF